jgi:hypothetical protein
MHRTKVRFPAARATANMQVKTYKGHLEGYNQLPMPQGERLGWCKEFFYFADDGSLWTSALQELENIG